MKGWPGARLQERRAGVWNQAFGVSLSVQEAEAVSQVPVTMRSREAGTILLQEVRSG
jgi:hypothetical protein